LSGGRRRLGISLLRLAAFSANGAIMKAVPDLPNHPKPLGPYSHCVVANGLVFISGQAPIPPEGKPGEWAAPDAAGQTRQCLRNIQSIVEELGLGMRSIVRATVFLSDPADYGSMNDAYKEFFPEEPPARSIARLGVERPGLRVSIDAIAVYEPRREP
jgi:2-iminobutanoate/2-iminopropanoate deaminase